MTEVVSGGGGKGKLTSIPKQTEAKPPKLNELPADAAEALLKSSGFPAGSGKIAQAGWSGHTEVTKKGISQLLSDAEAEAAAQQGGK